MQTSIIFIVKWQSGGRFEVELLDDRPGLIVFEVRGKGVKSAFANESGGHRWQRIPPTEKRGRVHTSTITVVVLEPKANHNIHLDESDLRWSFQRGSGKGGQHRNKTDTCVQLTHVPTKFSVRIDGRSQSDNKQKALEILTARVEESEKEKLFAQRHKSRKQQCGLGQRGDKVRTVRVHDNIVTHHTTGHKISYKKYSAGNFDGLF